MQKNKFSTDRVVPSGGAQSKNKLSTDRIIAMICISVGTLALMVTAVMTGLLLRDKDIPSHAVINSGHVDGCFPTISAGENHSLAITENGDLYSWGYNLRGELGLGDSGSGTNRNTPTHVNAGYRKYKAVAAGNMYSLAIAENGDLYAWGINDVGQLGLGFTGSSSDANPTPQHVSNGGRKYKAVVARQNHSLAIAENGDLYAWGYNADGCLGLGNSTSYNTPQHVNAGTRKYKAIAAGNRHSLAIAENGDLYAWGNNSGGQIGQGNTTQQTYTSPQPVSVGVRKYKAIAGGGWGNSHHEGHSLAIAENGDLYSWGYNTIGELGLGYTSPGTSPVATVSHVSAGSRKYKALAGGREHSLAIAANGDLYSWGYNQFGQLGLGVTGGTYNVPQHVSNSARKYITISAGSRHNLAIAEDASLYSWGTNGLGQLGLNDNNDRNLPTKISVLVFSTSATYNITATITTPAADGGVRVLGQPVAIAAGGTLTYAIDGSGDLYVWGSGYTGLGENVFGGPTPQHVSDGGRKYKAVSTSGGHTLAIALNGDLYGWGSDNYGQVGYQRDPYHESLPVPIYIGGHKFKAVAAAGSYSLAIAENGDLYSWGHNSHGQIGDPSLPIGWQTWGAYHINAGNRKYKAISAKGSHVLAIAENGDLYSWGLNDCGQLGLDDWTNRNTPQHVNSGNRKYKAISAGYFNSFAIAENGDLYAWGNELYGETGTGPGNTYAPTHVNSGNRKYKEVSAGYYHTLAIAENGDLYAWGSNSQFQLGRDDDPTNSEYPAHIPFVIGVSGFSKFTAIAAGMYYTIAITDTGAVVSCGDPSNGCLGLGSNTWVIFLTQILGL